MLFFSLAFVAVLVYAYPQNFQGDLFTDEPIEDMSSKVDPDDTASSLNANIFSDGTLVSSLPPAIDDSQDIFSSTVDGEDFGDLLSFRTGDDTVDSSLASVNGNVGSFIGNEVFSPESYNPENNPPLDIFDSPISTANCNSEADASTEIFGPLDSNSLYSLDGDSVLIASPRIPGNLPIGGGDPKPGAPKPPGWRYTVEPIYQLDPKSNQQTMTTNAFAANGTPLKPKSCPQGLKRSCCKDNTHTECWADSHLFQLCRFAKNLYCCEKVTGRGVPGVGCESVQWIEQRGRLPRDKQDPPKNQPNPLQGIFDLFNFPDLSPSPNPNSCRIPSRH